MELPLVLAGPILRRAEPRAVAVWVALSRPATVTLQLWEGMRKSGTRATPIAQSLPTPAMRIGESLYITVVVATRDAPNVPLQPGVNYAYDLKLSIANEADRSLGTEGLLGRFEGDGLSTGAVVSKEPLGYAAGQLPSFALPPVDLKDLRIVYGSCRLVANKHYDAMPWIDTLVEEAFTGQARDDGAPLPAAATARPHQLFLGGDQIYADDVSPLHLTLCNRLAHQLLSGQIKEPKTPVEQLWATGALEASATNPKMFGESLLLGRQPQRAREPKPNPFSDPPPALDPLPSPQPLLQKQQPFNATLNNFPAGGRYELTVSDGRFTSGDGESHLMSFGEFAAMYVSVFADWPWRPKVEADGLAHVLEGLNLDDIARSPGLGAGELPLYSQSLLDTSLVAYFSGDKWSDWNGIRPRMIETDKKSAELGPPDKKRPDQWFAHFMLMRLAKTGRPTGYLGFLELIGHPDYLKSLPAPLREELGPDEAAAMRDLSNKNASVFRAFMRQLQARVMRHLVREFGIAKVADVDCVFGPEDEARGLTGRVLLHGPMAILAEKKLREDDFKNGGLDHWVNHLERLLKEIKSKPTWKDFLKTSLQVPEAWPWLAPEVPTLSPEVKADLTDKSDHRLSQDLVKPDLVELLVTGWIDDPVAADRKNFKDKDDGYINLSRTSIARCMAKLAYDHVWEVYRGLHHQMANLTKFAMGQGKVRRALANVPTYMMFDDHDVTDDWNINPEWYRRVYAADAVRANPLGRQIVRNALASYAVFQDLGNDLSRYGPGTPGSEVLFQIQQLFLPEQQPWPLASATSELDRLFGLNLFPQPLDPARPHGRHEAVNAPMKWHYTVPGPQYTVAVLDNRTRRGFASNFGPPGNVGTTMIDDQVPAAPLPAGQEVLIVVAPLQVLAPSVFDEIVAPAAYRGFDLKTAKKIGVGRGGEGMPGLNPDAIESWALDTITFEALLARLAPHRKVVLLSGDVHNSTATQMSYWRRNEVLPSRILQFTSSGIKNVMPSYLAMIDHSMAFAQALIQKDLGGDRMGWLGGAEGAFNYPAGKSEHDVPIVLRKRIQQRPAHLPTYGWPRSAAGSTQVRPDKRPDFSWTLRPVFDRRPDGGPGDHTGLVRPEMASPKPFPVPVPLTLPAPLDTPDKMALVRQTYALVAQRHYAQLDRLGQSRQILFRSNLARVVFERGTDDSGHPVLHAVHQVITVLPEPLNGADKPHLCRPEVVMAQRAELTPPAHAVRPEDLPLNGTLGESLVKKITSQWP